jgi:ABC-2 type transport system ATP-binding protein
MSAIIVKQLTKDYGRIRALDALDLTVEAGSVFGFLGPNGAGKTTLLRILSGASRPTSGQAEIGGVPVGPESPTRRFTGFLPEEPSFYPWMTPRELLADLIGGLLGLNRTEAAQQAEARLAETGLTDAADRRIEGFSRGMRQRLGMAQALLGEPQVLLLDEPVSAMDPIGRREMLALINDLRHRCTVFMSSHILADVERVCDVIGIINHGRLVTMAPRTSLLERYAQPLIEVVFDDSPEAVQAWVDSLQLAPGLSSARAQGSTVNLDLADDKLGPAAAQKAVFNAPLTVHSYRHARPSLEDVFVRLVR